MHLLLTHPQLIYIIYFFISVNLLFFIGHLVSNFLNEESSNSTFEIFKKLSFGLITILIFSALFWTKGNTIFFGILIPLFFLLKNLKWKLYFVLPSRNQFIKLQFFGIPIILLQLLFFTQWGEWCLLPIDVNNHVELSHYFQYGIESKYAALNSLNVTNIPLRSPYHYADNWITTFLYSILPYTKIGYVMMYVVYPLLFTLYFVGINTILQLTKFKEYWVYLLSLFLLFLGPIDLSITRNIFDVGGLLSCNTIIFENVGFFFNTLLFSYHGQKHIPFYILSCWIVIEYIRTKDKHIITLLSIAPLINIGLAPATIGGVACFTIFQMLKQKKLIIPLKNSLPIIISTLFLIVFYKINGGYDIENQTRISIFNSTLNIRGEILKVIYKLSYSLFFVLFIYLFMLFLITKETFNKNKYLYQILIFILLFGFFTRIIFEGFNTPQFLTYILPLLNVFCIFLICNQNFKRNNIKIGVLGLLFLTICINNFYQTYFHTTTRREIRISKLHDKKFLDKIERELTNAKNVKIGYLLSKEDFVNIQPGFWYGYYPCEYLLTKDYLQFYSLNYPNYPYQSNSQKSNDFSPNHLRYFIPHTYTYEQYDRYTANFINEKNIHYLVTKSTSKIPNEIQKKINDSIIDPKSGDKFYLLSRKN